MRRMPLGMVAGLMLCFTLGCPTTPPDGNGGNAQEFVATLDAAQETQNVTSTGTGSGTFTLNAGRTQVAFEVVASGLSGPVAAAHFHNGAPGVDGAVVQDLSPNVTTDAEGNITIDGTWDITAELADELEAGNIYINIHTAEFPGGAIRGQLVPDGE